VVGIWNRPAKTAAPAISNFMANLLYSTCK
jgi:hypothetical protein